MSTERVNIYWLLHEWFSLLIFIIDMMCFWDISFVTYILWSHYCILGTKFSFLFQCVTDYSCSTYDVLLWYFLAAHLLICYRVMLVVVTMVVLDVLILFSTTKGNWGGKPGVVSRSKNERDCRPFRTGTFIEN